MEQAVAMPNADAEHQNTTPCNTTAYFLIKEAYFAMYGSEAILSVIGIAGMIGNIFSAIVFRSKQMKPPQNSCLIFLALSDTTFLFTLLYRDFIGSSAWTVAVGKIAWTCSIWATVCFSAKLFADVFFTLKAKSPCSHRKIGLLNLLVLMFAICFNIPHFCLLQQLSWEADLRNNFPYYYGRHVIQQSPHLPSWITHNEMFFEIWCMYLDTVLMYCVPLLFVITFSISSFVGLCGVGSSHRELAEFHHSESLYDKTRINTGIMVPFCVSYLSVLVMPIPRYYGVLPSCGYASVGLSLVSYSLVYTNSAFKFPIYGVTSKDFADTFYQIAVANLRCRKKTSKTEEPAPEIPPELRNLVEAE